MRIVDLLVLLTAVVAVVGLWTLFASRPSAGVWALIVCSVATHDIVPPLAIQVTAAGFNIVPLDVVTGIMLVNGVVGIAKNRAPRQLSRIVAVLVTLFAIHLLWGAAEFGLQTAVTTLRPWLYVLGPLAYATQARPYWTRASFRPIVFTGVALAGYALVRVAQIGLHGANTPLEVGSRLIDSRPLVSPAALLVLQCLLIAVSARFVRSPLWWGAALAMCTAVVLVQFRTVWLVALISLVALYLRWARPAIFVNERAALVAASAIFLVVPVGVAAAASSGAFQYSIRTTAGENSTLAWRTDSWSALVGAHDSPREIALGLPAGTSYERQIGDQILVQSPHSLYIDALLTFGIMGPVVIAWLGILVVRRRQNASAVLEISTGAVVLIVLGEAVFGITTMLGPLQGLLTGMLLQAAFQSSRSDASYQGGLDRSMPRSYAIR